MTLQQTVDALEAQWGLTAFVHASDIDGGGELGVRSDDAVVSASVFKLPVLVEACRQVAAGEVDPAMRLDLAVDDFRVLGPTGISVLSDPVSMSFRDLCVSMMTVSDNRATDVVMDVVGMERITATMRSLGLPGTVLEGDCAHLLGGLLADLGRGEDDALDVGVGDEAALLRTRALDPARTNRTTPREATTLLTRIWTDDGIDADACAQARRILGMQVWSHRLRSGFPDDAVRVSGKTGTLPMIRNEVGVVEHLVDGSRHAVAVFLRQATAAVNQPRIDAAIGEIAAAAVAELRGA